MKSVGELFLQIKKRDGKKHKGWNKCVVHAFKRVFMSAKVNGDSENRSIGQRVYQWFFGTFSGDKGKKLLFLCAIYFLIIAAYTILRDLKNSMFMAMVGKDYIPRARIVVMILFVPSILFYSKLFISCSTQWMFKCD